MNYDFDKDLKDGKEYELKIAELIEKKLLGWSCIRNNTIDCDIILYKSDSMYRIEVKNDFMASKTGNVAIEYECRGKKSGIDATIAKWWIHGIDGEPHFIKTDTLRFICLSAKKVSGGDKGSNTKMYLIPIKEFKFHCVSLDQFVEEVSNV